MRCYPRPRSRLPPPSPVSRLPSPVSRLPSPPPVSRLPSPSPVYPSPVSRRSFDTPAPTHRLPPTAPRHRVGVEPWLTAFNAGDSQAAWDLFAERYRRLMVATIKRLVPDHDDVMDVFSTVCQALSANDFPASSSTPIDPLNLPVSPPGWSPSFATSRSTGCASATVGAAPAFRRHSPRFNTRSTPPSVIGGHSHVEAYEVIRSRSGSPMPFNEFLREIRETNRIAPCPYSITPRRPVNDPPPAEASLPELDPAETAESVRRLAAALASQPADVRWPSSCLSSKGCPPPMWPAWSDGPTPRPSITG